jgi:hypothetical protein
MRQTLIASALFCTAALSASPARAAVADPLDSAIAVWQFAELLNPNADVNNTDFNRVQDLTNTNVGSNTQSDLTKNATQFTTSNALTVGNAATGAIAAANSDHLVARDDNSATSFLIRDLGTGGNASTEELVPDPNTSYTLFARVRYSSFNGVDDAIRVGDWDTATESYGLEMSSGKALFSTTGPTGSEQQLLHGTTLSTDTWYDVTGVFTSLTAITGSVTLYVFDPNTGLPVGVPATASVAFGSLRNVNTGGFNHLNALVYSAPSDANGPNQGAEMDLAAVWNTALSAEQVAALSALPTLVPEPTAMSLLALGGFAFLSRRRR